MMNSDDKLRRVWFRLVDSSGNAFQNCSADYVELVPSTTQIPQFRLEVKARVYASLAKLMASRLIVFKNKASLDAIRKQTVHLDAVKRDDYHLQANMEVTFDEVKNSLVQKENNQPLKSPFSLKGLGTNDEDNALMVVVPDIVEQCHLPSLFVLKKGIFVPCEDPYFTQLPTTEQQNDWLEFASMIPTTAVRKLYVRSAYRIIADDALTKAMPNDLTHVLVSGTPGIGKSLFLNYVFWRLVKAKQRVLILTTKPVIYFDGQTMQSCLELPSVGNCEFWTPDLWCLIDSVDPFAIPELPAHACSILLVSTSRHDHINAFMKLGPVPACLYMPIWTRHEMKAIASLYPIALDVWKSRFEILGGVPRLVFQDLRLKPKQILRAACTSCSIDDCIRLMITEGQTIDYTWILSQLTHLHSKRPYRGAKVQFASKTAKAMVVHECQTRVKLKVERFLDSCPVNKVAADLGGFVCESFAFHLLGMGPLPSCREYVSVNEASSNTKSICIKKLQRPHEAVALVATFQSNGQLYDHMTSKNEMKSPPPGETARNISFSPETEEVIFAKESELKCVLLGRKRPHTPNVATISETSSLVAAKTRRTK